MSVAQIAIGVIGIAVAVVALLIRQRKPRLNLALLHLILPARTSGELTEVSMLAVRVENRKRLLGDSAREVQCSIFYSGTVGDEQRIRAIMNPLPWVKNYPDEIVVGQVPGEDDYPKVLESAVFDRSVRSIPQGHHEIAIVSYGIKRYKKLYHATSPPLPLRIPIEDRQQVMHPFQLEVAGGNVASTISHGTVMMVNSAGLWAVPNSVKEIGGPGRFRNFLLDAGILGREQDIIPWADVETMTLRELKLVVRNS